MMHEHDAYSITSNVILLNSCDIYHNHSILPSSNLSSYASDNKSEEDSTKVEGLLTSFIEFSSKASNYSTLIKNGTVMYYTCMSYDLLTLLSQHKHITV